MGLFVKVKIDQARFSTREARELCARSCPVDALRAGETSLEVDPEAEDECILCDLCVNNAPEGAVEILRTYAEFMRS
jgi:NAD-dependent dihydropyrimidine dehydrogenase PreA subunit